MRLPGSVYADGIGKGKQNKFAGLNHNEGAGDGELWTMRNLTSDYYPLLATRKERVRIRTLEKPNGLFAWERLAWVDGTDFYYDGEIRGEVSDGEKSFAAMNGYILIMPDKKYYDVYSQSFGSMEATVTGKVSFQDGTLYGEEAEANTIYREGIDWADFFKPGDAVRISGATATGNDGTLIIREVDGNELRFYEFSFQNGEEEAVTLCREVPDLKYICQNENRLWGCDETSIYASKLGDPFNFYVYDGLSTDSFAVDSGSGGVFTGCVSYLGYPTFFKEQHIYKVYGSIPSNFEVMGSASLGLAAGSARSLAVAGETLFYLSRSGICMYTGGIPKPVNKAFGLERYKNGVAGSDGLKYYISMQDSREAWHLFVYDTQRGMWHEEDETEALAFAYVGGDLYFLNRQGELWATGKPWTEFPDGEAEGPFAWSAEFADFTDESPDKKGLSKLQIRLELDAGAECRMYLQMDSSGNWILPKDGRMKAGKKRSYYLAIVPQRADHYRIKLEGVGGCRVYSIAREEYQGSQLKSQSGRN